MRRPHFRLVGLIGLGVLGLGCDAAPAEPEAQRPAQPTTVAAPAPKSLAQPGPVKPSIGPQRTPLELTADLEAACQKAVARQQQVLLDFGADWCGDCRKLHAMKTAGPLAEELSHFQVVDVNITDPDRHQALMTAFDVGAIAHWAVLRPSQCDKPVTDWPRGPARVVEPTSDGEATSQALASWLAATRG